jgi:hypothetical protein
MSFQENREGLRALPLKSAEYGKFLVGCLGIALSGTGILSIVFLIIYSNLLQARMPAILSWAGVSRYHLAHYYTDASFVRAYRFGLVFSCLLVLSGSILYFLRIRILKMCSAIISQLKRLFVIHWALHHTSVLVKLDRCSGSALLGVASVVMVVAMFTMPIRADEAIMYDSVSSSILPLWAVAYIAPNNHVGYAALVWLGNFLWGDSIPGMRLFSFLAWVFCLVILCQIYIEIFYDDFSLSLIAISMTLPMIMTLGLLSRGYSLGALLIYAALLMALRGKTVGDALLTGFVGSLALWVVPSMLYGILLISGIILWKYWDDKKYAFLTSLIFSSVSMLGAIVLYLPILVVSGKENLLENQWVIPQARASIAAGYGAWLSDLFFGECKVDRDCPLFSGPVASVAFLSVVLQRLFCLPKRRLIVLALLPFAIFIFPLLYGRLPPPRAVAFIAPLILLFWGGSNTSWVRIVNSILALVALFTILFYGTSMIENDVSFSSNNAQEAASLLAQSPPMPVQTKSWVDYGCLRFYLRRAGWKEMVRVIKHTDYYNAPWVFEGRRTDQQRASHLAEGYERTSITGLYRAEARIRFKLD